MRYRNLFVATGIIILIAGTSTAGHVLGVQTEQERLSTVVDWVVATGVNKKLEATIAHLLELDDGSEEVSVVRKAFQEEKDQSVHRFDVVAGIGRDDIVLMQKNSEHSILWRSSKAGKILRTVRVDFSDNSVHLVPNTDYSDLFAAELKYWDNTLVRQTKTPSPKE
jgi:hypothetical protein